MDQKAITTNNEFDYIKAVYDSMFNFTQDAVALLDNKLNIVRSNVPFAEIAKNYSSLPSVKNIFDLILNEDDRNIFLSVISDKVLMKEITIESPKGTDPCILQTKMGPIRENGQIIGVYVIFVDITEFRKRENELNRRYKLICRLVENANLGIVIINQQHKVLEANQRFCEMLGYSHEEITELHTWDWDKMMDEEIIKKEFCDLTQTNSSFETIHRRKNGTTYHVTVSASGYDVFGDGKGVVMCICQDITDKKEIEDRLTLSEKKLRTYLENAADMILTADEKGEITYISPNCEKICGFTTNEIVGRKASDFFLPQVLENQIYEDPFNAALTAKNNTYRTFRMEHRDGTLHWYGITISKAHDENGRAFLICNARGIDKGIEKEKKLKQLSLYDHLTEIPNRAFFDAMLKRAQSNAFRPVSILVCDLNNLKMINDTYGHAKGDAALKTTASIIKSSLRKADFIARTGGDEFAVILPGADRLEATKVIERIHKKFIEQDSKENFSVSISVGMSTVEDSESSLEDALYRADMDMYRHKQENKSLSED